MVLSQLVNLEPDNNEHNLYQCRTVDNDFRIGINGRRFIFSLAIIKKKTTVSMQEAVRSFLCCFKAKPVTDDAIYSECGAHQAGSSSSASGVPTNPHDHIYHNQPLPLVMQGSEKVYYNGVGDIRLSSNVGAALPTHDFKKQNHITKNHMYESDISKENGTKPINPYFIDDEEVHGTTEMVMRISRSGHNLENTEVSSEPALHIQINGAPSSKERTSEYEIVDIVSEGGVHLQSDTTYDQAESQIKDIYAKPAKLTEVSSEPVIHRQTHGAPSSKERTSEYEIVDIVSEGGVRLQSDTTYDQADSQIKDIYAKPAKDMKPIIYTSQVDSDHQMIAMGAAADATYANRDEENYYNFEMRNEQGEDDDVVLAENTVYN